MSNGYVITLGIAQEGNRLAAWSGAFYSVFEADATTRPGARSATFTDYSGEKFRVELPEGVTFPRDERNWEAVDAAIRQAYDAHNARLGRVQMGVTA